MLSLWERTLKQQQTKVLFQLGLRTKGALLYHYSWLLHKTLNISLKNVKVWISAICTNCDQWMDANRKIWEHTCIWNIYACNWAWCHILYILLTVWIYLNLIKRCCILWNNNNGKRQMSLNGVMQFTNQLPYLQMSIIMCK